MCTLSASPSTLLRIVDPPGLVAGGRGGRLTAKAGLVALLGELARRRGGEGAVRMLATKRGLAHGGDAYGDFRGEAAAGGRALAGECL